MATLTRTPVQPLPKLPCSFMEGVAREEGFYLAGTRPQRNNNPGDIEWHERGIADAYGAIKGDPRFAVFPSPVEGFAAMAALFKSPAYKGKTVAEALNKWAPPIENQTNQYIINVCKWVGCKPTDIVDGLI